MKALDARTATIMAYAALLATLTGCVARPRLTPPAGTMQCPHAVTMTDKGGDVTIFYTTDGSAPTRSSREYFRPITVTTKETIQAIALTRDGRQSAVSAATYACEAPVTPELVLAGSPNATGNNNFAVINFASNPPSEVDPPLPFTGGTVVACNASKAAVGNMNGGQVVFYDLSNPASPSQIGPPVPTGLGGIGAISYSGTYVLVGEMNGSRAVLIDASSGQTYPPLNTGVPVIGSIALAGPIHAVAAGNAFSIDIIDYTNKTMPTRFPFSPGFGGNLTVDLDGTLAAVGDQGNASKVGLFDITTNPPSPFGGTCAPPCGLSGGINSISINVCQKLVAVGSNSAFNIALIDFKPSLPVSSPASPGGAGFTVVLNSSATRLAAGNVTGSNVVLFQVTGNTATQPTKYSSHLSSIGTISMCD